MIHTRKEALGTLPSQVLGKSSFIEPNLQRKLKRPSSYFLLTFKMVTSNKLLNYVREQFIFIFKLVVKLNSKAL